MSADYFLEIESHFARRRGTPFVLSAKDWALMKQWSENGVPLPIVIEAIDACFDKQDAKQRKVNGLSYCKHAVKELWNERRELQIGAEGVAPEEAPGARLEVLAATLEASAHATVRAYADRVRELVRQKSVPRIEEALMELETVLIKTLLGEAPGVRTRAEALAVGADEKVRTRSMDAHLRRLVREEFEIPRLTLF